MNFNSFELLALTTNTKIEQRRIQTEQKDILLVDMVTNPAYLLVDMATNPAYLHSSFTVLTSTMR